MADLLIVEDNEDLREVFAELLERQGHSVRTARDGREGLAAIAARTPDLIILDVEMPVLHGPGMAYQMFLHDAGQEEIPILLASGVKDLRQVADVVGTRYWLPKPFEVDELLRKLALALRERQAPKPRTEQLAGWTEPP